VKGLECDWGLIERTVRELVEAAADEEIALHMCAYHRDEESCRRAPLLSEVIKDTSRALVNLLRGCSCA